jgi:hypothetical protein
MIPDEIWDEHRWEHFLQENDRRIDRFMTDLYDFMRRQPPPDDGDPEAVQCWKQELQVFLEEKGWDRLGYLPVNLDDSLDELTGGGLLDFSDFLLDEEPEDDSLQEFLSIPVYQNAFRLGTTVLNWANALPGSVKDSVLVQYCSGIMEIAANISKGHSIGYEQETIGGNIACVKRSLAAANNSLEVLQEMKEAPYMHPRKYNQLYEQTFELRNSIALYIQDLRDRFNLGVD